MRNVPLTTPLGAEVVEVPQATNSEPASAIAASPIALLTSEVCPVAWVPCIPTSSSVSGAARRPPPPLTRRTPIEDLPATTFWVPHNAGKWTPIC